MSKEIEKFEIKFRGERLDKKGFIYGMPTYDLKYIFNKDSLNSPDDYEVIPETVGQFTGLKDKNGVEIYEGDVIYVNDYGVKINGVIIRDEVRTGFKIDWTKRTDFNEVIHVRIDKIEVIGNIHQNPELLNVKKP